MPDSQVGVVELAAVVRRNVPDLEVLEVLAVVDERVESGPPRLAVTAIATADYRANRARTPKTQFELWSGLSAGSPKYCASRVIANSRAI